MSGLGDDSVDRPFVVGPAPSHELGNATDEGERIPQLMAGHRQEFTLRLLQSRLDTPLRVLPW